MRKESLKVNYFFNMAYQVLLLIAPLITTPYVSRVLGATGIGQYSYTYSIVSYFLLVANMGTITYGQRTIAYCQDDSLERSVQFFNVLLFRATMTLVCLCAYGVFCFKRFGRIQAIQGIYLLAALFDISWFFQGIENFKRIVLKNASVKILSIVLVFLLVKKDTDLPIYCLILSLSTFLGNLSVWPYLPRYIKKVKISSLHPFANFKDILLLFLPTVATQVYMILDKTMLGVLSTGMAENGYYEQAEKIVRMALAIVTAFGTVMIPRIAKVYAEGNDSGVKSYLEQSFSFAWMLSFPIMFGLIGVSKLFVPVFFGSGYEKVEVLLPIYSCLVIPVALSNVVGCQYLIPTKQQNIYTLAVGLSALFNLFMNALLIPRLFSVGAALASVAAEYIGIIVMLIYINQFQGFSIRRIFAQAKNYFIAGALMLLVVGFISKWSRPSTSSICICVVIGAGIYFGLLFLLRDEFFLKNFMQIKRRVESRFPGIDRQ